MVKGNMKITRRDFAWLAVGSVIGAFVAVSLTPTSTGPLAPSYEVTRSGVTEALPASYEVTRSALTVALPTVLVTTNFQWKLRPVRVELPATYPDPYPSLSPMVSPPQRSLDLIDTRSLPVIKVDELK
jgi:hypothetical protein